MYTLEQIYEALGKIENGGTDGALKNLIATLTALQNAGGALSTLDTQMNGLKFQSTLLMRGATSTYPPLCVRLKKFQSTLLMRGATDAYGKGPGWYAISIHAPHGRSDLTPSAFAATPAEFNSRSSCEERRHPMLLLSHRSISIHAPHARSDDRLSLIIQYSFEFQSTLLMRGATCSTSSSASRRIFQSTLLMRGATAAARNQFCPRRISIHAPHAKSDETDYTAPAKRDRISIHAPHTRSDALLVLA